MIARRQLLVASSAALLPSARAALEYATVTPRRLVFPRDHGAHSEYRIEWWYLTGWLDVDSRRALGSPQPLGFQITFFRTRTPIDPANPSRFAAHQILFAHAAVADPARGVLLHDQRIARLGFGVAASDVDADLALDRWTFKRRASDGFYECSIAARGFRLSFTATPTQPLLLQGDGGFSRKGPRAEQASHYYSVPQLSISAALARDGRTEKLGGIGWLDHEWSSTVLDPAAAGWDWIGMNLDDGTALTAFQVRRRDNGAALHAYASMRVPGAWQLRTFDKDTVRFVPLEHWTSPRTRAVYPVAQRIEIGGRRFETRPLFADQEFDTRGTSGTVYWEGASRLFEDGRPVGRGYLELTGYHSPLTL